MSQSEPRQIFGVHSLTPYRLANKAPYGYFKVLEDSTLSLSTELVDNNGGSNPFPWATEAGKSSGELSLKFNELPDFAFELFFGKAATSNAGEANGNVSTLTNVKGSPVASVGLASVAALSGSEANLKFGKYLVVVASATTIDIYGYTDVDASRGSSYPFQNDLLKLTPSALTITTGGNTDVTALGLRFVGGAGTIGMTTGDTAEFEVRPQNSASMTVVIGESGVTAPEFGAIILAQKRSSGEMVEVDAYRCRAPGIPLGFAEKAWAKNEAKAKLLYSTTRNGVARVRTAIGL